MRLEKLIRRLKNEFDLPEGLCFLLGLMQRMEVPSGALLAYADNRPNGIFFLAEGFGEIGWSSLQGEMVSKFLPGDVIVPWMKRWPNEAGVIWIACTSDSVLYYISEENYEKIYGLYTAFWYMMSELHWRFYYHAQWAEAA